MFLGGNQRDRDSATAYSKTRWLTHSHLRIISIKTFPCLSVWTGMTVEMVAMLLASVIQGHVVAVYNTEKQQACQQLDHETPQSTSSSPHASLQETVHLSVKTLVVSVNWDRQTACLCSHVVPGISCDTLMYCSWLDTGIVSVYVCVCFARLVVPYLRYRFDWYVFVNVFLCAQLYRRL